MVCGVERDQFGTNSSGRLRDYLELSCQGTDLNIDPIPRMKFPRRFGGFPIDLDVAAPNSCGRQGPGLIKTNAPKPVIEAHWLSAWMFVDERAGGIVHRARRIQVDG